MDLRKQMSTGFICMLLIALAASSAPAQIEDQLTAYTGKNAKGYLQPLADAFGANLNDGLYHSAEIKTLGVNISIELVFMAVLFSDDDRTFNAVTESGFSPEQTVKAPTVVGDENAVTVSGAGGTSFAFPGGFNLNSFAIAAPQLRIGSVFGTEALIRYFTFNTGDTELGNLTLFGFGMRHNVTQYLPPGFPVDIAAGFFWQKFALGENTSGDDLLAVRAFTIGLQASTDIAVFFVPYAGLSYDTSKLEVAYTSEASGLEEDIEIEFDPYETVHLTLGLSFDFNFLKLFGEYNIASQNSLSFGAGFGFGF